MAVRIKAKGLDPYNLQGLGLVLLLPTILMLLVMSDEMPTEVIATLLGGVAGYIFGRGGRLGRQPQNRQSHLIQSDVWGFWALKGDIRPKRR